MDIKNISGKNNLYIDDARKSHAVSYNVDGATEQQTYTGKNLCGIPDQTFTHNNVTVTIKDGEITLNGTANATSTKWIEPIKTTTINGNYVNNCIYISGTAPSTNPANFNVRKSDGTIIQGTQVNLVDGSRNAKFSVSEDTSIIYGIYVQNSTTYTNYKFKPQLVAGTSEDYNYEPYVGGTVSPNPDYPQKVKTVPSIQNKFNYSYDDVQNLTRATKSEATNGFTITSTGVSGYGYASVPLDNSLLGKTVTISMKSTGNKTPSGRLFYLNTNGAVDGAIQAFWTTNNSLTITLPSTLPSGKKGIALVLYISQGNNSSGDYATFTDIQVEEGTSANEYVPYGYYTKVKVTGKNILNPKNSLNGAFSVDSTTETLNNDGGAITSGWIQCKPNTSYTLSGGYNRKRWQTKSIDGTITYMGQDSTTITTNSTASYIRCYYYYSSSSIDPTTITDVQLEEGETNTTYEAYKENQVLIDMSKTNLFDSNNANIINGFATVNTPTITANDNFRTLYIPCKENTTYTVSKIASTRFSVSYTTDTPTIGMSVNGIMQNNTATFQPFTTGSGAKYLIVFFYNYASDTLSYDEVLNSITIYESNNPTPYYELCKINTYKDTLSIDDQGNCIINKNIGKVVLNGGESLSGGSFQSSYRYKITINNATSPSANDLNLYSNYFHASSNVLDSNITTGEMAHYQGTKDFYFSSSQTSAANFKTWLSTHNTEVYYILNTPEKITLKNTPLPLFSGINHITFVDDFETDTRLTYENDISPSDKQALIDGTATIQTEIEVHGENLFDKDNHNETGGYYVDNTGTIVAGAYNYLTWVQLQPNTTYTLSQPKRSNVTVRTALFSSEPVAGSTGTLVGTYTGTSGIIQTFTTTSTNTYFAWVYCNTNNLNGYTKQEMLDSIVIEEGTMPVLTETNSVIDWNHEDFRQVKDEGFIGQFVARQVTGNLHNLTDDFKITDKELIVKLGVRTNNNTNWYSLGNFLTTKVTDDEVGDKTSFEALDYTKKFNKEYVNRVTYPCTALTLAKDVCDQCGVELGNFDFKNNDYVIDGNYFTNNESCRDVMKAIGKLAFSWVRVDWDNKVYVDFDPTPFTTNQIPETCDTIGNNKYYNLKTQKELYGPVDKVVIGYSAIEGERTYIGDEDGKCVLTVYDNPLVYSQERRASIIESARDLLGLTYTPLNTQTVGHPWLRADEPIKINDMESVSHITMPLDRTIQYFGHIKTLIDSTTPTKVDDNLSYKSDMVKNYERSEIYNDQNNKQIGIIIEEQSNTNTRLNDTVSTLDGTIQRVSTTETNIQDIVTTTQNSKGGNHLYLEEASQSNALSYSADGATEQQTYSGKNLFDLDTFFQNAPVNNCTKSKTETGIKITFTAGADAFVGYTGKTTGTVGSNIRPILIKVSANTTYTLSLTPSTRNSSYIAYVDSDYNYLNTSYIQMRDTNKYTFTTPNNTAYVLFRFGLADSSITTYTFNNIQLELGSTATTYEPYVGGIESPNPDFPQEVKTIPSIRNLLDFSGLTGISNGVSYSVGENNKIVLNGTCTSDRIIIPIKDVVVNGTYTFSHNTNKSVSLRNSLTNTTNLFITTSSISNTVNDTIKYIFIFGLTNTTFNNESFEFQLEQGSVSHEYVPYGYWSKVKVTGKNLFDKSISYAYTNTVGTWTITQLDTGLRLKTSFTSGVPFVGYIIGDLSNYIGKTVRAKTNFTVNGNRTGRVRLLLCEADGSNRNGVANTSTSGDTISFVVPTLSGNQKYLMLALSSNASTGASADDYIDYTNIIVTIDDENMTYEPYKENITLIDMSKPNLFETDVNSNAISSYDGNTFTFKGDLSTAWYGYIGKATLEQGKTYTISSSTPFTYGRIGLSSSDTTYPKSETAVDTTPGWSISGEVIKSGSRKYLTFTSNANQTVYFWYCSDTNNSNKAVFTTKISLFESNNPTPYYELCKIGDYKDILSIDANGSCNITKNIGKVVLNGSENWGASGSHYAIPRGSYNYDGQSLCISNYYLYSNNVDGADYGISIGNNEFVQIRNKDISTVANFKTWLSTHNTEVYYLLATPETIDLPNTKIPLFEGINYVTLVDDLETDTSISFYRQTPLTGTYATMSQLNDVSVEKTTEIQTVRKELLFEVSNERVRINAINETIDESGVPIVKTDTGYTFDIDGMKIEKSENDVSTIVDNDGLAVSYKTTEILTARSSGVEAENITTRKFYVQKPIRMEKTKSISDSTSIGLGFFYVGE